MTKWDLFQLCKAGSTFKISINVINKLKKKKSHNHISGQRKIT